MSDSNLFGPLFQDSAADRAAAIPAFLLDNFGWTDSVPPAIADRVTQALAWFNSTCALALLPLGGRGNDPEGNPLPPRPNIIVDATGYLNGFLAMLAVESNGGAPAPDIEDALPVLITGPDVPLNQEV